MPVYVEATGHCLPVREVTNDELSTMVDTNDQWIRERTGIASRHVCSEETTLDLAEEASRRALQQSAVKVEDIGLVIAATFTSNVKVPCLAACLRERLGFNHAPAFDINGACTGFILGVATAQGLMEQLDIDTALVVGVDVLSRVTDWTDRSTCVLFGDGAGAAILRRGEKAGILSSVLDGENDVGEVLVCSSAPVKTPFYELDDGKDKIIMKGQPVFKFAVTAMCRSIREVLERSGKTLDDVTWFVPHQANQRIIDFTAQRMGVDKTKFFVNLDHTGNTSAASIPMALDELNRSGNLHDGDLVLLVGFGGGLSSGAILIEWRD